MRLIRLAVQIFRAWSLKHKSVKVNAVPSVHAKHAVMGVAGTALPILDPGTRMGYCQRHAPTALPPTDRQPVPILQEGRWTGWAPKTLHLTLGFEPPTVQPVPSGYTDDAIRTPKHKSVHFTNIYKFSDIPSCL